MHLMLAQKQSVSAESQALLCPLAITSKLWFLRWACVCLNDASPFSMNQAEKTVTLLGILGSG